jgi:UDP-GlcNAc:undecaprenyl-phosphate GlcNAc-1-phosphate transferase
MAQTLFFSFVGSLMICMALIPPLIGTAGRLHILDFPGGRKIHSDPVAKVGGLALAVGVFVAILVWAPKNPLIVASLLGGLTILMFGFWDDRVGLSYRVKFLGQAAAVAIVMWLGEVRIHTLPYLAGSLPEWIAVPLTFVALLGVTNAINLADGLDGLAGGLALLSFAGMAYLAYLSDDVVVLLLVVSVLGGLLGFLRFNTYPARIFMGDSGSQFLGFFLGVLAVVLTDVSRGPYAIVLAPLLVGLPLLDTLCVMSQRISEGRSPFLADQNHLHHKLLGLGFSHREAVLVIYALQAGMVISACLLRWESDGLLLATYAALAAVVCGLFYGSGRIAWRRSESPARKPMHRLEAYEWLGYAPLRAIGILVTVYLAAGVFLPARVPRDVGMAAGALLVFVLAGTVIARRLVPFLVRFAVYVGGTFVVYLSEQQALAGSWPTRTELNVLFSLLAVLVVLTIRFSRENRFETTPLDYLIVFFALAMPLLPELSVGEASLSLLTGKLIVLFFSYELLFGAQARRVAQLGAASCWLLMGLFVRAWWG